MPDQRRPSSHLSLPMKTYLQHPPPRVYTEMPRCAGHMLCTSVSPLTGALPPSPQQHMGNKTPSLSHTDA